jgi:hypothetical protein
VHLALQLDRSSANWRVMCLGVTAITLPQLWFTPSCCTPLLSLLLVNILRPERWVPQAGPSNCAKPLEQQ